MYRIEMSDSIFRQEQNFAKQWCHFCLFGNSPMNSITVQRSLGKKPECCHPVGGAWEVEGSRHSDETSECLFWTSSVSEMMWAVDLTRCAHFLGVAVAIHCPSGVSIAVGPKASWLYLHIFIVTFYIRCNNALLSQEEKVGLRQQSSSEKLPTLSYRVQSAEAGERHFTSEHEKRSYFQSAWEKERAEIFH